MKNSSMKASSVRSLLIVVVILLLLAGGGAFYLALESVKKFAVEVSHSVADASASGKQVEELQHLKQALAARETLVAKANKVLATPSNYQSQTLRDIQRYASRAGVSIAKTNFDSQAPTVAGSVGSSGRTVVITLEKPVSYTKLLRFMSAIEGNLPKMQIMSIELSRPTALGSNSVTTGNITIEVAVR